MMALFWGLIGLAVAIYIGIIIVIMIAARIDE